MMETRGFTTSAVRNRKRRRKAARNRAVASTSNTTTTPTATANIIPSSFLSCCAVGLAFGQDAEDDQAYREYQKKQYEERVKQQQMHEEAIRKQYLRSHGTAVGKVLEQIEVVE